MATVTLRPNADGFLTEWSVYPSTPTTHYDKVDEETPDEDSTYIYITAIGKDYWNIEDPGVAGVISNVRVYVRARKTTATLTRITIRIYTYSTEYYSGTIDLTTSYVNYYFDWATNPKTGSAWTWTEITNLQIGVRCASSDTLEARVTQAYCVVTYTAGVAHTQEISEILGMLDSVAAPGSLHKTVTDQLGMLDSAVAPGTLHKTVTDSLGMVDTMAAAKHVYQTITDLLGLVDSVATKGAFKKVVTEILGLLETVVPSKGVKVTISEILGMVDSESIVFFRIRPPTRLLQPTRVIPPTREKQL